VTVFADDSLFACRERNQALLDRVANLRQQRDAFKRRALRAEARPVLRGRKFYGPEVEKWRGLLQWCFDHWANKMLGRDATEYEVDFGMGLVHHESSGYHLARCHTEWIGTPPPGYDGTDATRATGLCAHVPLTGLLDLGRQALRDGRFLTLRSVDGHGLDGLRLLAHEPGPQLAALARRSRRHPRLDAPGPRRTRAPLPRTSG